MERIGVQRCVPVDLCCRSLTFPTLYYVCSSSHFYFLYTQYIKPKDILFQIPNHFLHYLQQIMGAAGSITPCDESLEVKSSPVTGQAIVDSRYRR